MADSESTWSAVELRSPGGTLEATFVLNAGMVGWSLRHHGEELVAHQVPLETLVQAGKVSGIPLLHPWANRLAAPEYEVAGRRVKLDLSSDRVHTDPAGLPIHGLVVGWPHWEVLEQTPTRLRTRLDYAAWPELMAGFPFPHALELAIELSDGVLGVDTELAATGGVPVPVAFGYHPYLQLPGLDREEWHVELPVSSRMELDDRMLPTGVSEPVQIPPGPLGDHTYDDAFDGLVEPREFVLAGAGRRLAFRFGSGYRFAQVYAPPHSQFICFEPMTAAANPFESDLTLLCNPGDRYTARFEISVEADPSV